MRSATAARTTPLPVLVTRAHLRRAGLDLDVALRAARSGAWQDVLPGSWLRLDAEVTRAHRQQAALELLGPEAMLTGPDACEEYGLRDVPADDRVHVLLPHAVRRDLGREVRVVRTTLTPASYVMRNRRWSCPARAVLDAAAGQGLRDVRALVTAAVADAWVCPDELAGLVDAEAVRRRRLPPFLLNPDVFLDGELLLAPDLWLVGTGVGGELDSKRHHGSQSSLDATLARHARAERAGLALVHRSPQRLRRDPQGFVAELQSRVAETPEPVGLVVVPRGPLLPLPGRR